jgi:hypothetical protein
VERAPGGTTDLNTVLGRLVERLPRPGVVVVISDLFGPVETLASGLSRLGARNHDVVVLHVLHGDELRFPFDRLTRFEGMEEELRLLVDPRSLRPDYLAALDEWRAQVRRPARRAASTTTWWTRRRRWTWCSPPGSGARMARLARRG